VSEKSKRIAELIEVFRPALMAHGPGNWPVSDAAAAARICAAAAAERGLSEPLPTSRQPFRVWMEKGGDIDRYLYADLTGLGGTTRSPLTTMIFRTPEEAEAADAAWAGLVARVAGDGVGEGYRKPVDSDEAVLANQAGVLERCMDGIPHGPDGWERNGLIDDHVRQGLGVFRVPGDWSPVARVAGEDPQPEPAPADSLPDGVHAAPDGTLLCRGRDLPAGAWERFLIGDDYGCDDYGWTLNGDVEVDAPYQDRWYEVRPVPPEPETERVPLHELRGRRLPSGLGFEGFPVGRFEQRPDGGFHACDGVTWVPLDVDSDGRVSVLPLSENTEEG